MVQRLHYQRCTRLRPVLGVATLTQTVDTLNIIPDVTVKFTEPEAEVKLQ